jgi:hypothetical protein
MFRQNEYAFTLIGSVLVPPTVKSEAALRTSAVGKDGLEA